jgi:hypothetical protein
MKANLISPRAQKSCRFLQDVTLRPEPHDLFLQGGNLSLIDPHLPVPGKGGSGSHAQFPYAASKHALGDIQITGSLGNRHAPIRHQPDRLNLELVAELPSRHIHSPVRRSRSYLRVHQTGSSPEARALFSRDGDTGA